MRKLAYATAIIAAFGCSTRAEMPVIQKPIRTMTMADLLAFQVGKTPEWLQLYTIKADGKNQPWLYRDDQGYRIWMRPPGWESLTLGEARPMPITTNYGVSTSQVTRGMIPNEVRSNDARFSMPGSTPPIVALHGHDASAPCGPKCPKPLRRPTPSVPVHPGILGTLENGVADLFLIGVIFVVVIVGIFIHNRRRSRANAVA